MEGHDTIQTLARHNGTLYTVQLYYTMWDVYIMLSRENMCQSSQEINESHNEVDTRVWQHFYTFPWNENVCGVQRAC